MDNQLFPPISKFTVNGVHGYKKLSINFVGPATIVVAENGSGKTTLLNALNAFLSRRFHKLASIKFSSIECVFSGSEEPIILRRDHISSHGSELIDNPFQKLTSASDVTEDELVELMSNYEPTRFHFFRTHPIVRQMYISSPYDYDELETELNNIHFAIADSFGAEVKEISEAIKRHVGDIKIVHLPTYRRIERPLIKTRRARGRTNQGSTTHVRKSEGYDDIAFGLGDVEARLAEISEEIERRSNLGYRSLSTKILNEMIRGDARKRTLNITPNDLPDLDALLRFLNRVGRERGHTGMINQDLVRAYKNDDLNSEENWFLTYFLVRLGEVIDQTREMELRVEQFVNVCNSYLTLSGDEKSLYFDPQTLRVVVHDLWLDSPISLKDLSSGEKQIVSLMATLYLSQEPKLILLDEPELSLSIKWQKKVLPDVINSGSVVQMLAITHSPFIFENELDAFAVSLQMAKSRVA